MAQHPQSALPSDPNQYIWRYYELFQINPIVFDDHLFIQVPLVDKSLIMNVYKVYNLPILHPTLQKTFCYSVAGQYVALSSDSDYVTIP